MAKIKRKHLAALDAMEKQTPLPLLHHAERSDAVSEAYHPTKKGYLAKLKQSEASLPSHQPMDVCQTEEGDGDPTAEVSHDPSLSPVAARDMVDKNVATVAPSSPNLQQQGDDSDTDSWVDVRKQRVIIIIPPLPRAQPSFLKTKGRNRVEAQKQVLTGEADNKPTENNTQRSNARQMQERICADGPLISGMDILLASALDTNEHMICKARHHGRKQHHAAMDFEAAASLDTADSSAQPKNLSLPGRRRGLKATGQSNGVAQVLTKRKKGDLCKVKMNRKGKKTQQVKDEPGLGVRLDAVDSGENRPEQNDANFAVLSCTEALRILMLKKHVEKAGGLRGWLCSVGLGQFMEAFEKKRWSEADLLQLQMDDLKKMGIKEAVGPRRKLIWAINYFSHLFV